MSFRFLHPVETEKRKKKRERSLKFMTEIFFDIQLKGQPTSVDTYF